MSQPVPKASCGHSPDWAMSGVSKRPRWGRTAGCGWGVEDLCRMDICLNGKFSVCGGGSCLFVSCLTSQQHVSVSQGRICSDNFTCCHTEIEVADQAFYLTKSPYTDTGPTSPSADPITPGAWQGSHWSANF